MLIVADSGQSDEHESNQNHVHKTAPNTTRTTVEHHTSVTQINTCSTTQSKCSSLPSGVSLSPVPSFKLLTRSKSNVVSPPVPEDIIDETVTSGEKELKKDDNASFFSRLLLRRSSKKKKNTTDEQDSNQKPESEVQSRKVMSSEIKEESTPVAYMNGLNNAMKHHPLFRQRIEPLNLSNELSGRMHMSMVPVNMNDEMKTPVKKSHSFRNHEKLPYSCYEDTPSLPVNIGLVEDETVTERFNKHFHKNHTPEPFKFSYTSTPDVLKEPESLLAETPDYEPVGFRMDNMWRVSPTKVHDYSNISMDCNKVNISVGDGAKGDKNDAKAPVPAPRTSLLNKSPEPFEKPSKDEYQEEPDSHVNVTVTELSSGQRSIVSIGSIEMNSEPSSPLVDSVFEPNFEDDEPEPVQSYVEELENVDVPEKFDFSEISAEIEQVESPKEFEKEIPVVEEPSGPEIPPKPLSPKPEFQRVEKAEKPTHIVVTDFANGIVKVNDTTVVMRRKTRDMHAKDDEPELMKVFARRSLKLKETDNLEELIDSVAKSRDSDKENEDFNSSSEERKKPEIKSEPSKSAFSKFHRSLSHDVDTTKNVSILTPNGNEKRQRCKSIPNEMDMAPIKPPPLVTNGEEKSDKVEIKSENIKETVQKVEKVITPFKGIQQRREEWEKRAQHSMKVRGKN